MLREILAITGKPGLYKMLSHNGRTLIVEELTNGKRFPVSPRDRVVSLGDIAMYTESEDKPLGEILDVIYEKEEGKNIDIKEVLNSQGLKAKFEEYVPDFDKERVHDNDVKKLFTWYNLLRAAGYEKFTDEDSAKEVEEETRSKDEEVTSPK